MSSPLETVEYEMDNLVPEREEDLDSETTEDSEELLYDIGYLENPNCLNTSMDSVDSWDGDMTDNELCQEEECIDFGVSSSEDEEFDGKAVRKVVDFLGKLEERERNEAESEDRKMKQ